MNNKTPPRRASLNIDESPNQPDPGAENASLDLAGFTPRAAKPAPQADIVREVSEQAAFHSREAVSPPVPRRRRRRSNRTIQFNVKLTPETIDKIAEIADDHNWTYAELVEHAVTVLEEKQNT